MIFHAALSNYPTGGTFKELLKWHLAWGTCPGCNTQDQSQNKRWKHYLFAEAIAGPNLKEGSAKKNLGGWLNGSHLPNEKDALQIEKIFWELFGDDPNLDNWKEDLEQALTVDRDIKNAKTKNNLSVSLRVQNVSVEAASSPDVTASSLLDRLEAFEKRILQAVSADKNVPIEWLEPIFNRLGRYDVPAHDYERVLSEAVDELLEMSRRQVLPSNYDPQVDVAIMRARERLAELDITGAAEILSNAIHDQRESRLTTQRAEAKLIRERAEIGLLKAFNLRMADIFDYAESQRLDPDYLEGWFRLARLYINKGLYTEAFEAYCHLVHHAKIHRDRSWEASGYEGIAGVSLRQKKFNAAMKLYERSAYLAMEIYLSEKSEQNLEKYISVSLKLFSLIAWKISAIEAIHYRNKLLEFIELNCLDKASFYLNNSYIGLIGTIARYNKARGHLDEAKSKYKLALRLAKKRSVKLSDFEGVKSDIAYLITGLSSCYDSILIWEAALKNIKSLYNGKKGDKYLDIYCCLCVASINRLKSTREGS